MSARLDLPDAEIVLLVDVEGMTFAEVKEHLGLDCHVSTIRRHYKQFKKENQKDLVDIEPLYPEELEEMDEVCLELSLWERIKNWFRKVF